MWTPRPKTSAVIRSRPNAGSIAVVDVETTGLFPYRHDRVVEIGVVVMRADGSVVREFTSLVNPLRDIGPSRVHGLTSEDVLDAPEFPQIAAQLVDTLIGTVAVAGHNIRFDQQFLAREFDRVGASLPAYTCICTMQMAGGGSLSDCCHVHGVAADGPGHSALVDARSTAKLLAVLLSDQPTITEQLGELEQIQWPLITAIQRPPVTRERSQRRYSEPSTYIQRLLRRRRDHALPEASDGATIAYGALLDRALEDRRVEDHEADALAETATRWGLTDAQIEQAHRDYLKQLIVAAVADGNVSEVERQDLRRVARLLGQIRVDLDELVSDAMARLSEDVGVPTPSAIATSSLQGRRVCFTGELQGLYVGKQISRALAEEFATSAGLVVVSSVTKSCDLLVVADPNSQSGKAKKARMYGIRIMHESVFWKAIGINV